MCVCAGRAHNWVILYPPPIYNLFALVQNTRQYKRDPFFLQSNQKQLLNNSAQLLTLQRAKEQQVPPSTGTAQEEKHTLQEFLARASTKSIIDESILVLAWF